MLHDSCLYWVKIAGKWDIYRFRKGYEDYFEMTGNDQVFYIEEVKDCLIWPVVITASIDEKEAVLISSLKRG